MIDPTTIIHQDAVIGENVEIGPYSVIGSNVEIKTGSRIGSHVTIDGPTTIGKNNHIFQFCSIGGDPQDKKYKGETESKLLIGDGNTIREFCSINRGTVDGGGVTSIGNSNWIMAYVHIAHDCLVGDQIVFANNSTLAGHVKIDDYVILGGFTGVHQFCHIGHHSFSAISSVIVKDVPPYLMVTGNTAKPNGLNREGLKRHDFSSASIKSLSQAYKVLYREGLLLKDAIEKLEQLSEQCQEVAIFAEFIKSSKRGIAR